MNPRIPKSQCDRERRWKVDNDTRVGRSENEALAPDWRDGNHQKAPRIGEELFATPWVILEHVEEC